MIAAGSRRARAARQALEPPVTVRVVDIDGLLGDLEPSLSRTGLVYRMARVVVRRGGRPLGEVDIRLDPARALRAEELREAITSQLPSDLLSPRTPAVAQLSPAAGARLVSAVITTCGKVDALTRCITAVGASAYPSIEILVVDNRPATSGVRRALAECSDARIRVVDEPRQGLSRARNAGLAQARGEIVAFTDDDTVPDPQWLVWLERAFADPSAPACVTGLILPYELETRQQITLEQFARFGKGFEPRIFDLARPPAGDPLFPYAGGQFGSGANMALDVGFARRIGGFDPYLGTGTPAQGGEDLDLCARVLLAGGRIAYEPAAIVLHQHPDGDAHLRSVAFRYGVGLSAMLAKHLTVGGDRRRLIGAVPDGIRYLRARDSPKHASKSDDFPATLEWLERLGMLCGPAAYLKSRVSRPRFSLPRIS
ncbi:MAG: hypothetical protein QOD65_1291 [Gaiellales bacterium]|nr:hypothetical protein [Gaiellales bacterium]